MHFERGDELTMFQRAVRDFCEKEIKPHAAHADGAKIQCSNKEARRSASLGLLYQPLFWLDHIESDLLALPLCGYSQKSTDRVGDLTTLADHAAHIIFGHTQFKADA